MINLFINNKLDKKNNIVSYSRTLKIFGIKLYEKIFKSDCPIDINEADDKNCKKIGY